MLKVDEQSWQIGLSRPILEAAQSSLLQESSCLNCQEYLTQQKQCFLEQGRETCPVLVVWVAKADWSQHASDSQRCKLRLHSPTWEHLCEQSSI